MKKIGCFIAIVLSAFAGQALADMPYTPVETQVQASSLFSITETGSGGSTVKQFTKDEERLFTGQGDSAQSAVSTTGAQQSDWGIDLDTSAHATFEGVEAVSTASWTKPGGPTPNIIPFESSSLAQTDLSYFAPTSGKVRFKANYEIRGGAGAVSTVALYGGATVWDEPAHWPETDYAELYLHFNASDAATTLSGSWTSKWLDYDAEQESYPSFQVTLLAGTGSAISSSEYAAGGSWNGYARITSWEYEVIPIPEPESYALIACGLAGIFAARRMKRRAALA